MNAYNLSMCEMEQKNQKFKVSVFYLEDHGQMVIWVSVTPLSWEKRAGRRSGQEGRGTKGKIRGGGKEKTSAIKTTILEDKYHLEQCLNLMIITTRLNSHARFLTTH